MNFSDDYFCLNEENKKLRRLVSDMARILRKINVDEGLMVACPECSAKWEGVSGGLRYLQHSSACEWMRVLADAGLR